MRTWPGAAGLVVLAATIGTVATAQTRETAIGVTGAAATEARGFPPVSPSRILQAGVDVLANERVTTSADGRAQLVFRDGSALTVGPGAEVVLDSFVYDPESGTGELAMSASKGVLRLVGGKLSKDQPVRIAVPSATIGIRGGVALLDLRTPGATTVVCLFCLGVEARTDGGQETILRPGFALTLRPGEPPGRPVPVTQALLAELLVLLEGVRGDAAGAPEIPSDERVRVSPVEARIAEMQPGAGLAPPPPPETGELTTEAQQAGLQPVSSASSPGSTPATPALSATGLVGRFKASSGGSAGGSGDGNASLNIAFAGGAVSGGQFTAALGGGSFFAPAPSGSFSFEGSMTGTPLGPLAGAGMFDVDAGFLFFSGDLVNQPGNHAFLFAGTPTPSSAIPTSGIGAFQLGRDPIMGVNLPFLSAAVGGNLPATTVSPAYVLWAGNRPFGQSSLGVSGSGSTLASAIAVNTSVLAGGATPFVQSTLRGSYRANGSSVPVFVTGGVASADGGDGSDLFGAVAPSYLVLEGATVDATDTATSRGIVPRPTPTTLGTTYFPNNLASAIALPSGVGATRTSGTETGWASGASYRFNNAGALVSVDQLFNSGSNAANISITRDVTTGEARASFGIQTPVGTNMTLKLGVQTASDTGRSLFVDDDRLLLIESSAPGTDAGSLAFAAAPAYLATAAMADAGALLPSGVTPCTCAFMTWGVWGADLARQNGQVSRIHLAQFVTGRVTSAAELAGLAGTATFTGHEIGTTLIGPGALPTQVYETGGKFTMTWTFPLAGGSITISQFDPQQFGGAGATITFPSVGGLGGNQFVQFAGSATPAAFSGSSIIGNFNNGTVIAEGVSGRVDINATNYRHFGVFAASR